MSRRVNEVKHIFLTLIGILHLYSMTLDSDTTFLLQLHIVEHLALGNLDRVGVFQQAVSQGRLTVVDVCNDAKVSNMFHSNTISNVFCYRTLYHVQHIYSAKLTTLFGLSFHSLRFFISKAPLFLIYSPCTHIIRM